jgi:hypothetical protein
MRTKNAIPLNAGALLFLSAFILNLTACKKEMIGAEANQIESHARVDAKAKAATSITSNEQINIELSVFVPCANAGAGEIVQLIGTLHVLTTFTINGNNVRGKYHYQPQGISGIGLTTGDKYQATGVTQDEFKGSLVNGQFEETYINNFRIIGVGKDNNILFHENSHLTITANGVVTTVIDNIKDECK